MSKWEMVRLGDVCEIVSGTTPSTNNAALWDGTVKWVTPAELSDDSFIIYDTIRHISTIAGLKSMPCGTVLLSSRAPIGKVAITGAEMCCNQGFKNLICSERIHNQYLYCFLKSKTGYLNSLGRGATFKEISKEIVENIKVPLPTIFEQQRFSTIIEKITLLISQRKQQLEQLDLLVKSRFVEMFGDPVTNPMGWEKHQLCKHITFLTSGSRGWSSFFSTEGQIFLTIKNVKRSGLLLDNIQYVVPPKTKEAQRTKVQKNDLLISITADLGRTAVVTEEIAKF